MSNTQIESRFTPHVPQHYVMTDNHIHRDMIVSMLESEGTSASEKKELEPVYSIIIITDSAIRNMMSSF